MRMAIPGMEMPTVGKGKDNEISLGSVEDGLYLGEKRRGLHLLSKTA